MLRQQAASPRKQNKDRIRWRCHEVLRIEAFSDAVFAFAITLLIVSLEVPHSFEELLRNLRGFIPFAICFTLIFQVWYAQNIFFRRFGLHDVWTIVLNAALVFTVLFFVYPLKFLYFAFFTNVVQIASAAEMRSLYYIYSGGFAAIYLLIAALYWHALHNWGDELALSPAERFEAKTDIAQNLFMAGVGLLSVLLAAIPSVGLAAPGLVYILIGPLMGTLHGRRGKVWRKRFGDVQSGE